MDKDLVIAVVSDLHCRHGKESQISTHLYTELPRNPKEHHPIESLKQLIKRERLVADLLLCPGDITDRADSQGLSTGWEFIKEISKELQTSFFTSTVGNHDVNSRSSDANPFQYLLSFRDDYPVNDEDLRKSFWALDRNFFLIERPKFLLLNYNSTFNHLDADRAKRSMITDEIIEKMKDELNELSLPDKVKIALCHHHPQPFSNVDQFYKDGDLIERGDKFLKLLLDEKFDLVVHGHKHIPRLEYYNASLPVFCAGSFSSLMNVKDISGKNTFHIIKIKKEDSNTYGTVFTWEFTKGHGWLKASSEVFFPYKTGFGFKQTLSSLETKTVQFFEAQGKQLVSYQELSQGIEEINFLNPAQQEELTNSLIKNHKIEFLPNLKFGPKYITKQLE